MASATLNHFPPDTKVEVWTKTGDSFDGGGRGKQVGSVVQAGTDGSLVLYNLDDDEDYWAVGDTGLVIEFTAVDPDPRGGSSGRKKKGEGRAAAPTSGKGKRASSTDGLEKARRPSGGAKPLSATQLGGSGRTITADDEKLTGRPGVATQEPPKKKARKRSSAKKARKAAKKTSARKTAKKASTRKAGRKGIRGARGTKNARS